MDNERELRSEFRRALEVVTPPAPWLGTNVTRALGEIRDRRGRPSSAVALVMVLILLIAGTAIFIALHSPAPARSVPAGTDKATFEYAAVVQACADGQGLQSLKDIYNGGDCFIIDDTSCPAKILLARAEAQKFLVDLSGVQPPSRLAAQDTQLRAELCQAITDLDAMQNAYDARDQQALETALRTFLPVMKAIISDVLDLEYIR